MFLIFYRGGGTPDGGAASVAGDLIILAGAIVCALGYVTGAKLSPVIGTWATTFWGLAIAAALVAPPVVALLAPRTDWVAVTSIGWLSMGYLAFLGSITAYAAWFWALGHGGITRMSSWQLGQPVVTFVFAAILLGEAITLPLLAAGAVVLAGTALAQTPAERD